MKWLLRHTTIFDLINTSHVNFFQSLVWSSTCCSSEMAQAQLTQIGYALKRVHAERPGPANTHGLHLEEGSCQEKWELWRNLFMVPEARELILDSLDLESALACRLVCQEWRVTVNYHKKLWAKINQVLSIAVNLFVANHKTYQTTFLNSAFFQFKSK